MEINDALIKQWEPKVQKMTASTYIAGMDREDLAQELRIALLKSAKAYDESRGIAFHTYLHTALVNTIRTLISKAQRKPYTRSMDAWNFYSPYGNKVIPNEIARALRSEKDSFTEEVELNLLISSQGLSDKEQQFLKLKFEGLTMDEITEDLRACRICVYCLGSRTKENELGLPDFSKCLDKQGDGAYKIRNILRETFGWLNDESELESDS